MRSTMSRVLLFFFFMIICRIGSGQEFSVTGRFLADSVMIGEKVAFSMAARHSENQTILFPDSSSNFFPFEFIDKKYTTTKTRDGISYDSAVYYLQTFEIDSILSFSLPAYIVNEQDCTRIFSSRDSILVALTVKDIPDSVNLSSLPLKPIVAFHPIPLQTNYLLIIAFTASVLFISGAAWMLFGKKIKRYYILKKLNRNYEKFMQDYTDLLSRLQSGVSAAGAESTLFTWKKYMENLELIPYTKLTTKETIRIISEESLTKSLQAIDRTIYGDQPISTQPFELLRSFAKQKYMNKLQEVKHA